MIASSHWQFLGYDEENSEPQWAVTCTSFLCRYMHDKSDKTTICSDFSKTLFTPAGLDIYMRHPLAAGGESGTSLLRRIIDGIASSPDKMISRLAKEDGFLVGGST
jgi:hypothetical protein